MRLSFLPSCEPHLKLRHQSISDTDLRPGVVASADVVLKLVNTVAAKMLFDQPVLVAAVVIITGAYLT